MVLGVGSIQRTGEVLGMHSVLVLILGLELLVIELRKIRWVGEHIRHWLWRVEVGR